MDPKEKSSGRRAAMLFTILRHGQALPNGELAPEGEAQIDALASIVAQPPFSVIWVSTLARAKQTGARLGRHCGSKSLHMIPENHRLSPLKKDAESDVLGAGQIWQRVEAHRREYPETSVGAALARVPGGVDYMAMKAAAIWSSILDSLLYRYGGNMHLAIIGHENTAAALLWQATGKIDIGLLDGPNALRNTEGGLVRLVDNRLRLESIVRNPWYDRSK